MHFLLISAFLRLARLRLAAAGWQEVRWSNQVLSQCSEVGKGLLSWNSVRLHFIVLV